jgi:uncharacterized iron-regulated membrane protein
MATEISETGFTTAAASRPQTQARVYGLLWRLHFYAGLLVAPILIWAAITGTLYVFNPQIEAFLYRSLYSVTPQGQAQSLDAQLAAVRATYPDALITQIAPAPAPDRTTQFVISPAGDHGHAGHHHGPSINRSVYVNPYTAMVVGDLAEEARFKTRLKNLHGNFMQGETGRVVMELGASWLLILLLSGVVLWFPRTHHRIWGVWLPRLRRGGRIAWRDLHSIGGVVFLPLLIVLVATGLTWSHFSGQIYGATRDALGQNIPLFGAFTSGPPAGLPPISIGQVERIVQAQGVSVAYTMTPPRDAYGAYRIITAEPQRPQEWRFLVIDQYSGVSTQNIGWADTPLLMKLSIIGIPFHRGELGLWNQVVNTAACLMIIGSVISGVLMWWKRRPAGAPPRQPARAIPRSLIIIGGLMLALLPTAGASFLVIALIDQLIARRIKE